jgi:Tfp pilus assembly PilM family ATPase
MTDGISFFSNDDVDEHVKKVISLTNYTDEEAKEKLRLFNCDYMLVLKDYMGISTKKKEQPVKSVNQEIYRQIRQKLDNTMKDYREKNPINMDQVITNLKESDERERVKIKND